MLIRIVKMTFELGKEEDFLTIFHKYKEKIRNAEGCTHLQLLRDKTNPNIFFTYSHWQDEVYIEKYRKSETFGEVWPQTKALFSDKPEAWSVEQEVVLH